MLLTHRTVHGGAAALVAGLLALSCGAARADGVHVSFSPATTTVQPGDTFTVQVQVTPADAAFNAFDLYLAFNPARLAFVTTTPVNNQRGPLMVSACSNEFHVFTPGDSLLSASLSLLCNNVTVTGPGVIYIVRFRALTATGPTTISCTNATSFYNAGIYVLPVDLQSMTVNIGATAVGADTRGIAGLSLGEIQPNPGRAAGSCLVSLSLARATTVRASLVGADGRAYATTTAPLAAGEHVLPLGTTHLPSGTYWLCVTTSEGEHQWRRWTFMH